MTALSFGILLGAAGMLVPPVLKVLEAIDHPILERIRGPAPSAILPLYFGTVILITGLIAVLIMHPDVEVENDRFRLRAPVYRSKWLPWKSIREVRSLWLSPKWSRQIGVVVEGVSPLYFVIGATQQFGFRRVFIVHQSLQDFTHFFGLLREKRPDLFDEKGEGGIGAAVGDP